MSDEPQIPAETIEKARQLFIDMGTVRGGRTADEWSDEEVIVAFRAMVKVVVQFAREFRLALAKSVVQINQHFAAAIPSDRVTLLELAKNPGATLELSPEQQVAMRAFTRVDRLA